MMTSIEQEKIRNEHVRLLHKKSELEAQIMANVNDRDAVGQIRADYRKVLDELEKLYNNNINCKK